MTDPVVVYHPRYMDDYPTVSVECPARLEAIREALAPHYRFLEPDPASEEDLLRVHGERMIESVRREDPGLYEVAALAAGGAIRSAREALADHPALALVRPPGHHAGPHQYWGFCFFNNIAIALAALLAEGSINGAMVLDFDLHFGDGTEHFFAHDPRVNVINVTPVSSREEYISSIARTLDETRGVDIIGVSAGFDIGREDWGGLLTDDDFKEIGNLVRSAADRLCQGHRFAVLEGGYNLDCLGENALAFCRGFF